LYAWAALACYLSMIVLGSIPGQAESLSEVVHDKMLHFVAYGVLSVLVYGAVRGRLWVRGIGTIAVVGLLGAIDEGIQSFLPYRQASWADWQVDLIAALLTVTVMTTLQVAQPRRGRGPLL
ncbi:MAG TPA: VanZ family protein, partial [Noviherbaspirillum sp.]|nr:VanZ family protein [Noviherbaspirillum sp.]